MLRHEAREREREREDGEDWNLLKQSSCLSSLERDLNPKP
jgi:hypothetical protein